MKTTKKRFSLGWYIGLALGVAAGTGAAVYAVTLPNTFSDGQTASAAAVNANFQALADAINGCPSDMARVGSSCIDTAESYVTATTEGCAATGAGCASSAITVGTTPATPAPFSYSWGQAVAACTNVGKRLASSREIIAAHNAGIITVAAGSYLYADATAARDGLPYAGTFVLLNGNTFELGGTNTPYTEQFPNTNAPNTVAFRCAR